MRLNGFINAEKQDIVIEDTKEVDIKLIEAQRIVYNLEEEKKEILRNSCINCENCSTISKIKNLTYIQTHYYVPPFGCTGGAYWEASSGEVKCPACNMRIRLYEFPELMKLKWLFQGIEDSYDKI